MAGLSSLGKLLGHNWCPVPKATSQQSCNSKIGVIATISDRNCFECSGSILGHCCLPPVLSTCDKIHPAGRRPTQPPARPPAASSCTASCLASSCQASSCPASSSLESTSISLATQKRYLTTTGSYRSRADSFGRGSLVWFC